jgi:hypothetical protein
VTQDTKSVINYSSASQHHLSTQKKPNKSTNLIHSQTGQSSIDLDKNARDNPIGRQKKRSFVSNSTRPKLSIGTEKEKTAKKPVGNTSKTKSMLECNDEYNTIGPRSKPFASESKSKGALHYYQNTEKNFQSTQSNQSSFKKMRTSFGATEKVIKMPSIHD